MSRSIRASTDSPVEDPLMTDVVVVTIAFVEITAVDTTKNRIEGGLGGRDSSYSSGYVNVGDTRDFPALELQVHNDDKIYFFLSKFCAGFYSITVSAPYNNPLGAGTNRLLQERSLKKRRGCFTSISDVAKI
jgi:hypothetical protein